MNINFTLYPYIKVKLIEGEKKWLRQSRTELYLPTFFFCCKRHRNYAHKTYMIRSIFSFPLRLKETKGKTLNIRFSAKKQVNF